MRICNKCGETKPLTQFFKLGGGREGFRGTCKPCYAISRKTYRADNAETIKAYRAGYLAKNREKYLATCKAYREKYREECIARSIASQRKRREHYAAYAKSHRLQNPEMYRGFAKKWWSENRHKTQRYKAVRRAAERNAYPKWAADATIKEIYQRAAALENVHVDHIVPLVSPLVCGLHVADNLQILTASENMSKSNRYWPDMP